MQRHIKHRKYVQMIGCAGVHLRRQGCVLCHINFYPISKQFNISNPHLIATGHPHWWSESFWYIRPPLVKKFDRGQDIRKTICRGHLTPCTNKTPSWNLSCPDVPEKRSYWLKTKVSVLELRIHTDPWDPFLNCAKRVSNM